MPNKCKYLIVWVFRIIGLVTVVGDLGCLIYTGVKVIPTGNLFGKTLTVEDQGDVFFSLWICAGLLVAPLVASLVGLCSRKAANFIIWYWYGYAATCGYKNAAMSISVLYYLQMQKTLERIRITTPQVFDWSSNGLSNVEYWWWFARITVCLVYWLLVEVRKTSQEAGKENEQQGDNNEVLVIEPEEQADQENNAFVIVIDNEEAIAIEDEEEDNEVVPMNENKEEDNGNNNEHALVAVYSEQ